MLSHCQSSELNRVSDKEAVKIRYNYVIGRVIGDVFRNVFVFI